MERVPEATVRMSECVYMCVRSYFKHTLPYPDLILGQSVKLMGLKNLHSYQPIKWLPQTRCQPLKRVRVAMNDLKASLNKMLTENQPFIKYGSLLVLCMQQRNGRGQEQQCPFSCQFGHFVSGLFSIWSLFLIHN